MPQFFATTRPDDNGSTRAHDGPKAIPAPPPPVTADRLRQLIRDNLIDDAHDAVAALLDRRIAAGETDLRQVNLLLQHYRTVLSRQPPLSHIGSVTLRPSDQLYACFDQFVDLLRQQGQQIAELQAMISELL